ncbi:hypothetical protein MAALD49_26350 [Marinobacter shengliensis]|nr:hypothetical protein MAALD49_26350 [Marinobacter shengliensis]
MVGVGMVCLILVLAFFYFYTYLKKKSRRQDQAISELSKRLGGANENARYYENQLRRCIAWLPVPVVAFDLCQREVIEESDELIRKLGEFDARAVAPEESFVFYFHNPETYPGFLPELRKALNSRTLRAGSLVDSISIETVATANLQRLELSLDIEVKDNIAFVAFNFSEREAQREKRAHFDNRIIRSILNETDIQSALSRSVALLHCELGRGLACSVSLLDAPTKTLHLIWQKGMDDTVESFIRSLPVIFGDTPPATAAFLEKQIVVRSAQNEWVSSVGSLIPEQIVAWHSYPIKSIGGEILGTLDVMSLQEALELPVDDGVANFLFVASVLLERKSAMSTIIRQTRVDQLTKEVSQRLLAPKNDSQLCVLRQCLTLLQGGSDLSVGKLGILYVLGDGAIECMGDFFDLDSAASSPQGEPHDRMGKLLQDGSLFLREEAVGLPDVKILENSDYWAKRIIDVLPVCTEMRQASMIICPILSDNTLRGLFIFGACSEFTQSQIALLSMVTPSITNYLIREHLLSELQSRANHDQLTGLLNRGCIEDKLKSEVERSRRYTNDLSIVLFDIDHFKSINDSFGHDVGDEVLKRVARRVKASLRSVDLLGRWGGEEFLIILAETDVDSAKYVAENIRRLIEADVYGASRPVTVSAGIACFREGDDVLSLVKRADLALYEAKEQGRNQVRIAG